MPSFKPLLLIIGSGPNIGASTSKHFLKSGWSVALASRSLSDSPPSYEGAAHTFKFDASKPSQVEALFTRVKREVGQSPSAVLYNVSGHLSIQNNSPTSWPVDEFTGALAINTLSFYAAAREAIKGFDTLPEDFPKTILYTGNGLISVPASFPLLVGGLGKTASSYFIEASAPSLAEKGVNIYFVDERKVDGSFAYSAISGTGHAEYFYKLATDKKNHPWLATFVTGKGYVDFSKK